MSLIQRYLRCFFWSAVWFLPLIFGVSSDWAVLITFILVGFTIIYYFPGGDPWKEIGIDKE